MSILQMGKMKPEIQSSLGLPVFRSFSLHKLRTHCPVRDRPAVGDAAEVSVLSAGLQASLRARWSCQLCPTAVFCGIEGSQRPSTLLPSLHPYPFIHLLIHPSIQQTKRLPLHSHSHPSILPFSLPPSISPCLLPFTDSCSHNYSKISQANAFWSWHSLE